ncbi:hypothetical protein IHE45_01G094300 [Dioscorea alata]|uniref:Uncharacterized protein n=1 Tax=Dioscorea alata TaxID=55571 RepID=A0ACB7WWH3_DIOAL|nr:hypothetical protein IHE45_01G094300 [Dioscorea alata]
MQTSVPTQYIFKTSDYFTKSTLSEELKAGFFPPAPQCYPKDIDNGKY